MNITFKGVGEAITNGIRTGADYLMSGASKVIAVAKVVLAGIATQVSTLTGKLTLKFGLFALNNPMTAKALLASGAAGLGIGALYLGYRAYAAWGARNAVAAGQA